MKERLSKGEYRMDYSYIDKNFEKISKRIKAASEGSAYGEAPVFLAAIKSAEADEVNYLCERHGVKDVGENRVQQLLSRYDALNKDKMNIHFIGSLQTNKVKYIVDKVCMIHSLDRIELAREIDKQAKKIGKVMDVLVEINIGEEESKGGVSPKNAEILCEQLLEFSNVRLRGFMTMAPKCDEKEDYLKYFSETYQLVLDIWQKKLHNIDKPIISMGMSESFEEAILCGSNMVRIGRSLFNKNE